MTVAGISAAPGSEIPTAAPIRTTRIYKRKMARAYVAGPSQEDLSAQDEAQAIEALASLHSTSAVAPAEGVANPSLDAPVVSPSPRPDQTGNENVPSGNKNLFLSPLFISALKM